MLRKVKFYKHLFLSANSVLHYVQFCIGIDYGDGMLRTVFMPLYLAVDLHLVDDYVGLGV